ncbi:MAG: DUF885 domain-containing protein [Candidatus Nanopelagicales bacterium]
MNEAQLEFAAASRSAINTLIESDPVAATSLGDHRCDDRLPDRTDGAVARLTAILDEHLARLDAVDDVDLELSEQVDLEILRARVTAVRFDMAEVQRHKWDPLMWNPSSALYLLTSRAFAPVEERWASARARLQEVPAYLADGRSTLGEMSGIHVETAIAQLSGFDAVAERLSTLADEVGTPIGDEIAAAEVAVAEHVSWLREQLPVSTRDPRLGVRLYSAAVWNHLDEEIGPGAIVEAAESHLDEVTTRMREVAAEFLGTRVTEQGIVQRALDQIAQRAPVTDATVLPIVRRALARCTEFVRDHDLVTVPDLDTRIIDMPEIHRGIAVAYCDAPGPLEDTDVATYVAVAPTPDDWTAEQVDSFYREYNEVLLHELTIHEAMPGHVLQLAHARRDRHGSLVRRFGRSGVFVEGWAVYAEQMMLDAGYTANAEPDAGQAIALQHLKMQARMSLNAILDVRVHGGDIVEHEAIDLLVRRGFQEPSEAQGKWRRALLTATQLPTYFVGYLGVRSIADDLRVLHPGWSSRQVHDLVLSEGSPGPRHLRALLGL